MKWAHKIPSYLGLDLPFVSQIEDELRDEKGPLLTVIGLKKQESLTLALE